MYATYRNWPSCLQSKGLRHYSPNTWSNITLSYVWLAE